jgi:hypothetical protein
MAGIHIFSSLEFAESREKLKLLPSAFPASTHGEPMHQILNGCQLLGAKPFEVAYARIAGDFYEQKGIFVFDRRREKGRDRKNVMIVILLTVSVH